MEFISMNIKCSCDAVFVENLRNATVTDGYVGKLVICPKCKRQEIIKLLSKSVVAGSARDYHTFKTGD